MYVHARWPLAAFVAGLLAFAVGCTLSIGEEQEEEVAGPVVAALSRSTDCDDLLDKIHGDVIAKIDVLAQRLRNADPDGYYYDEMGVPVEVTTVNTRAAATDQGVATSGAAGAASPPSNAAVPSEAGDWDDAASAPSEGASSSGSEEGDAQPTLDGAAKDTSGGETSPSGHSDTNVQVEGVDEADIVKVDAEGEYIYLLHGGELFMIDAWEPASTAVEGQIDVEGSPLELFVYEGTAVVFSTVYDQDGSLGGDEGNGLSGLAPSDVVYYPGYGGAPFTKVTLIDVANGAPSLLRELYVEGSYLSSRRHETIVRAVVQGGFKAPVFSANIEYYDPWGNKYDDTEIDKQVKAWRERMVSDVEGSTLDDWLPIERERKGDKVVDVDRRCGDFYIPSPGLTDYGSTNIVAVDLSDASGPLGGSVILGEASEVYASGNLLLLAHNDWSWHDRALEGDTVEGERTALHRFDLKADISTDGGSEYVASGFVQGHIKDQFSLDEQQGYIRVATMRESWNERIFAVDGPVGMPAVGVDMEETDDEASTSLVGTKQPPQMPDNRVISLKTVKEDGELVQVGITAPLGHPREEMKSVRFLDDVAYVVTFRQTDPLIAVDLSENEPKDGELPVLGELEINGFSEYMHPLGDDHLLTIGRNADPNTGRDLGLMLQIFDVSDPAHPESSWSFPYQRDGWSEASTEHKAFTFYADRDLLAFPFVSYEYGFQSSLEVFRVTVEDGFAQLGSIDHTALLIRDCPGPEYYDYGWFDYYECGRPALEVRRGVFISGPVDGEERDYVYSISYGGVMVHDLADLLEPVAEVPLPTVDPYAYDLLGTVSGGVPVAVTEPGMIPDVIPMADATMPEEDMGSAAAATCGNGIIEAGEQCDGADLGGATCQSLGGTAGILSCSPVCLYDVSMCSAFAEDSAGSADAAGASR